MPPAPPEPRNVVLVGFMGTGKSTVGRRLASELRFRFLDIDAAIVKRAGMQIPQIFRHRGEDGFREIESETLDSIADLTDHVIATGGGIVGRDQNRAALRQLGFVVWLKASPDAIFERVSKGRNRPMLHTDNPRKTIADLLETREPLYREIAHMSVDTPELTTDEIAYGIAESARHFFIARAAARSNRPAQP